MAEYCPHTPTCPFYQNWVEQTGSERVDIILTRKEFVATKLSHYYNCLALFALNNPETNIIVGEKLKTKLLNENQKNFSCSHITLLNRLED